ncbi:sensor histidine kinase [Microbacteriaceae bacterium 4G12]
MRAGDQREDRPRSPSVRARILAAILAVAALGMLVAGGTASLVQRERALAVVDERLLATAAEAADVAAEGAAVDLTGLLRDLVRAVRPDADQGTLALIDGQPAFAPEDADLALDSLPGFAPRVVAEAAGGVAVRGTSDSIRYIAIPVSVQGDARTGLFVAAYDLDARLRPIGDAFRTFAAVAAVALLVLGGVGWVVAGRLLRPIRDLRLAAARITASDVSERIPLRGRDDVSDLTRTVNEMLDRLDGALRSQRRLLDDLGHELKTPITIVRGHLEVMDESDPTDVASTRALAIDELDRMSGLVRDITALATASAPAEADARPSDIASLTAGVLRKASALSGHRWVTGGTADVVALVDPERITQALLQLASNAVRHGAPDGSIEIGSALVRDPSVGDRLRLWVRNEGAPISDDTRQHMFERFRRGSAGRGSEGSGLGLAIVEAIATAHGGGVLVRSAAGEGTTITLDLPFRPAAQQSQVAPVGAAGEETHA